MNTPMIVRPLLLVALASTQACIGVTLGDPNGGAAQDIQAPVCASGEVVELAQLNKTEGLAFGPDGWLYAGSGESLWRVLPDGRTESVAPVATPIGIGTFGSALVVAQWGASSDTLTLDGSLAMIELPAGTVTALAQGQLANPNAVVATAWGTVLVSDDLVDDIYEVDPATGSASLWAQSAPSPNGMVFSGDGSYLYVASTFVDNPPLNRISISGRSAGERQAVAEFASGTSPDGIARDSQDRIYVALNTAGQIVRYEPRDGSVTTVAQDLLLVASMAIPGQDAVARGYDSCSLYAVQLRTGLLWQVPMDLPSLAQP